MGRQVNFYALPDDLSEFARIAGRGETVALLACRAPTTAPREQHIGCLAACVRVATRWYLARSNDVSGVQLRSVPTVGDWYVDGLRSNVIEFDSGAFDGRSLSPGRLYFQTGCYDDSGSWVEKPEPFTRWASGVLAAVRRLTTPTSGHYRVGPAARRWVLEEGGKLLGLPEPSAAQIRDR